MASVIIIDDESFTEETPQSMDCSESPADNKLNALRTALLEEPNQNQAHFEETASGNSVEDESRAEAKKLEGNVYYKNEKYFDALKCYTEAIRMKPKCPVYYGNRSACYVMLGDYRAALDDARHAVELDAGFIKGYLRQIKCLIALGEWESAQKVIDKVKALDPENVDIKKDEEAVKSVMQYYQQAKDMIQRNAYDKAAALASLGLTISSQSTRLKLTLAEAKINMRKFLEGTKFTDEILRADPTNTDSIYVKGLALYYQGNLDYAITHFQRALKFEPDHAKAREVLRKAKKLKNSKEKANEAFAKNDLETAYKLYSEGIDADPLNTAVKSKLHFNRSLVHAKRKNFNEAIGECSEAIKLDDSYIKAYLKRAQLYTDQEMYQEAVQDYETVYDKHKSMEFEQLLNKAKAALARSKKRDFYKVLGIPKTATDDEIKKAYKKHAMLHHPDRHSNAPEDVKMEEEAKFKQVLEAYNTLSDQKKRCMYDLQQNTDTPVYGQRQYNPFNNDIFSFFTSAETGNYSYTYNR